MYHLVHVPDGTLVHMKRQELLAAVIADLAQAGLRDRSLRDIAAAVGTSHRMLIHHFGSRHGLMTAVVEAIEEDQKRFMESLDGESGDIASAMWQRLRDPQLWPAERLFFECYARALHGEPPFDRLLPGSVDDWLERTVALDVTPDVPPGSARTRARFGLAVFRGLLLDLVGTGDLAGVDAAFAEYAALAALSTRATAPEPVARRSRDVPDRRTARARNEVGQRLRRPGTRGSA
jgi:AcrR family transcriptional regulator